MSFYDNGLFEIVAYKGIDVCSVCGAHDAAVECMNFTFDRVEETLEGGITREKVIDDRPICYACRQRWNKLSRQLGREVPAEEFLTLEIIRQAKTRAKPRPYRAMAAVEFLGTLHADLAAEILRTVGRGVNLVCPECGNGIETEVVQGGTCVINDRAWAIDRLMKIEPAWERALEDVEDLRRENARLKKKIRELNKEKKKLEKTQ